MSGETRVGVESRVGWLVVQEGGGVVAVIVVDGETTEDFLHSLTLLQQRPMHGVQCNTCGSSHSTIYSNERLDQDQKDFMNFYSFCCTSTTVINMEVHM